MRKLSVTEYLASVNQPTVTARLANAIYARLGDAINALTDFHHVTPEGEEAVTLDQIDGHFDAKFIPPNVKEAMPVYEVGCYAIIGHICVWKMMDNRIFYTVESA
jgi:hypothetical protein